MPLGSAWPEVAYTADELPTPLGEQLTDRLEAGESLERLFYVPANPEAPRWGFWARTRNVQVLAVTDRRVMGRQGDWGAEPSWTALPYDQVLIWSVRQELLYGLLAITGDSDGELTRILLEFNTAREEIVTAALVPLEARVLGIDRRVEIRSARGGGEALLVMPSRVYKFYNYLHSAILPGERTLRMVFQELAARRVAWLWRRLVTPGTLLVGTDRRLLVLREQEKLREPRYGHTTLSLPRRRAASLAIRDEGNWLSLHYAPPPGGARLPGRNRPCARTSRPGRSITVRRAWRFRRGRARARLLERCGPGGCDRIKCGGAGDWCLIEAGVTQDLRHYTFQKNLSRIGITVPSAFCNPTPAIQARTCLRSTRGGDEMHHCPLAGRRFAH